MSKLILEQKCQVTNDGQLHLSSHQKQQLKDKLKYFSGKRITMTIKEDLVNPTQSQRGYYRGVLLPIWKQLLVKQSKDNMLVTLDMLHIMAKKLFLPPLEILINSDTGETFTVDASTSNEHCSKEMYSVLIEGMVKFLAEEYGEVVPEPNEQVKLFKEFAR